MNSIPGKTITGEFAIVENGKNKKLLYDEKTVVAHKEDGKIILQSLIDGVVEFHAGKITWAIISSFMEMLEWKRGILVLKETSQ